MSWQSYIEPQFALLLYVSAAMILGAVIGYEREIAQRPAGLRTHMLVAGAAAFLVLLAHELIDDFNVASRERFLEADPLRVLEAVITGVSFLGAGTIIKGDSGRVVLGLTTAASLLFSAAIGVAVALSQFIVAAGLTAVVFVVLRIIGRFEQRVGLDSKNP